MTKDLVSIIIPTFNRASLLSDAISSALTQSYAKKQIIVIDDGSEDNTKDIVAQFQGIEYYYQENKGQAAARNLGLNYAKGEYIASLDSDDIWHKEFLTDSVRTIKKHNLDFVFLSWNYLYGKNYLVESLKESKKWRKLLVEPDEDWYLLDDKLLRWLFLQICPSPSSSLLIRRSSIVSSWNEEMIIADDWFLLLEMVTSKPCRAAFTLSAYWTKRIFGDNIYDGTELIEIHRKLGLHDSLLIAQKLDSNLTASERRTLSRRLAHHKLHFGRLSWKSQGISKTAISNVAQAFASKPMGTCFEITRLFRDHIKARVKLYREAKIEKTK
jgi:glycosyltransferase involved in cell wall biosynthesis